MSFTYKRSTCSYYLQCKHLILYKSVRCDHFQYYVLLCSSRCLAYTAAYMALRGREIRAAGDCANSPDRVTDVPTSRSNADMNIVTTSPVLWHRNREGQQ